MKKEEFPTFLNERPAIIFGRDGRQLLILGIGLALAYLSWLRLGFFVHGNVIASDIAKGIIAAILIVSAAILAFVKVAARPLEEWAFIWLFYLVTPKVLLYIPAEVGGSDERQKEKPEVKSYDAEDDDDLDDD